MSSEIRDKIRPLYSEFQGCLSQAPDPSQLNDSIYDASFWNNYNMAVEELCSISEYDYNRFKIVPEKGGSGDFIYISTYRQKVGGLISRLHGTHFSDEQAPFSGMPNTVINQTQQQNVSVQMVLDIQSKIDETLSKSEKGSKEEGFLKKFKSNLGSIKNANELITQCTRLAKESGLNIQDLLSLWGG